MAQQINFNPQPWGNPIEAAIGGVQQGMNVALTMNQVKEQKTQREFERGMQMAQTGLELSKGMPESDRARVLNQHVVPFWNKMNPDKPMAEFTPRAAVEFKPVIGDIEKYKKMVGKNGYTEKDYFQDSTRRLGSYLEETGMKQEATAMIYQGLRDSQEDTTKRDTARRNTPPPSPENQRGAIMQKWLASPASLNPQEQVLMKDIIGTDPAMQAAVAMVKNDPRMMVASAEEQMTATRDFYQRINRLNQDNLQMTPPAAGAPPANLGVPPPSAGAGPDEPLFAAWETKLGKKIKRTPANLEWIKSQAGNP